MLQQQFTLWLFLLISALVVMRFIGDSFSVSASATCPGFTYTTSLISSLSASAALFSEISCRQNQLIGKPTFRRRACKYLLIEPLEAGQHNTCFFRDLEVLT